MNISMRLKILINPCILLFTRLMILSKKAGAGHHVASKRMTPNLFITKSQTMSSPNEQIQPQCLGPDFEIRKYSPKLYPLHDPSEAISATRRKFKSTLWRQRDDEHLELPSYCSALRAVNASALAVYIASSPHRCILSCRLVLRVRRCPGHQHNDRGHPVPDKGRQLRADRPRLQLRAGQLVVDGPRDQVVRQPGRDLSVDTRPEADGQRRVPEVHRRVVQGERRPAKDVQGGEARQARPRAQRQRQVSRVDALRGGRGRQEDARLL